MKAVEVEQRRTADLETAEEPMPQLPASAPAPAPTPVPATTDAQPTLADRNLGGISLPFEPQKKKQKVALSSPEQAPAHLKVLLKLVRALKAQEGATKTDWSSTNLQNLQNLCLRNFVCFRGLYTQALYVGVVKWYSTNPYLNGLERPGIAFKGCF